MTPLRGSLPKKKIRVVVVNWNRRELLRACLVSLAAQDHASYEVLVVDNGSSDGSVEMMEEMRGSYPVPLLVIRNQENRGFCAANNQGFEDTGSDYIALLNNDAEAEPGWLTAMDAAMEHSRGQVMADPNMLPGRQPQAGGLPHLNPEHGLAGAVGMVASKILVWEDPTRIDKCGHLIYPDGQNRGRGSGQKDTGQFDRVEEVLWPDGCAAMYRRAMLEDVGGFDEEFFAYADDAELGLRARQAGWKCLYTPRAVVRHHRGSTLGKGSARRLTLIERNRVLLAVKLFPWNLLWANGAYLLARIGAGAWAALRNRGEVRHYQGATGKLTAGWALLRGTVSALPMIPSMLRKRRALRLKRRMTPRELRSLLLAHRISLKELSEQAS